MTEIAQTLVKSTRKCLTCKTTETYETNTIPQESYCGKCGNKKVLI